jgi:oxygen-independent coproporphyrinogen-3 oxidase
VTDLSKKEAYVEALFWEIERRNNPSDLQFDTVYFGGGTPSTLSALEVERALQKVKSTLDILPASEITLEINPGTVTDDELKAYRRSGVTRISVGVQSFSDRILKTLGRIHTAGEAAHVLTQVVDSGFDRVGIDLIYGIPGQTMDDWRKDIDRATEFGIDHVSCYMLSFEPGTAFERKRLSGQMKPLPDSLVVDMYKMVVPELARRGYHQYEVSNFARPGCQSRHNVKYWNGVPYIGLGTSAHSFDGATRSWNHRDVDQYIQSISRGCLPIAGREELTKSQHMLEAIYLGLRTTAGIKAAEFEARFHVKFSDLFGDVREDLDGKGLIEKDENRLALTMAGMIYLDSIVDQMSDRIEDL